MVNTISLYEVILSHSIKNLMAIKSIKNPKIKFSLSLDSECANLTPKGADKIVIGVIINKPKKFI